MKCTLEGEIVPAVEGYYAKVKVHLRTLRDAQGFLDWLNGAMLAKLKAEGADVQHQEKMKSNLLLPPSIKDHLILPG